MHEYEDFRNEEIRNKDFKRHDYYNEYKLPLKNKRTSTKQYMRYGESPAKTIGTNFSEHKEHQCKNSDTGTSNKRYNYGHIRKMEEENTKLKMIKDEMEIFYLNNRNKHSNMSNKYRNIQSGNAVGGKTLVCARERYRQLSAMRDNNQGKLFNKAEFSTNRDRPDIKEEEKGSNKMKKIKHTSSKIDADLEDEIGLFLNFVLDVNEKYDSGRLNRFGEEKRTNENLKPSATKAPQYSNSDSSFCGSDMGDLYACSFCSMKYTYRRCLANHVKKKH